MSAWTLDIRDDVPADQVQNALTNFGRNYGAHQTNSAGDVVLWSAAGWNCGTARRARQDREPVIMIDWENGNVFCETCGNWVPKAHLLIHGNHTDGHDANPTEHRVWER